MNADALLWHRLQFAFTIVYHYLFPQLTMGLAALIVVMQGIAYFRNDEGYAQAARFFTRLFGVNFAMGVATGLPMEFQFGTNWSRFSGYAGGVIGHSLGMESLFAFFLESSFLGLVLFGEKRLSKRAHFGCTVALWIGTWASGYFIVTTNAFMQHPVGYVLGPDQKLQLGSLFAYMTNPWGLAAYAHTMMGALVTGSFVVTAVGAYYLLSGRAVDHGRRFLKVGTIAGLCASLAVAFPTGDIQAKLVGKHQPITLAAMEGHFETESGAPVTIIGQPNIQARRLDNPVHIPFVLSFLAYGAFHADVRGLNEFPESDWPTNIELLYYGFHLMVGIGTIQIALMALANALRFMGRLERYRPFLWLLCLCAPLPYIANTAGWMTAEMGRQPWLVYGLYRTAQGASPKVHSGDALFTLIGFAGIYVILSMLFLFLVGRIVQRGPDYEPRMADLWFAVAAFVLAMFVLTDGFDFGAGALLFALGKSKAQRGQVHQAIGPFWDGNEVWLLAFGGCLFVAFPEVLGIALSGFYLPLFMIIWLFIARAMSIELRHHAGDTLLVEILDVGFVASSLGLPLLLGVALGNVVRGVPLQEREFAIPLFLTPGAAAPVGVLDLFTVGAGLLAVAWSLLHGACFVALRTTGEVAERARDWSMRLPAVVVGVWVLGLGLLRTQVPAVWSTLWSRPSALLCLVLAGLSLGACLWAARGAHEAGALAGSTGFAFFVLAAIALSLHPHLLRDWAGRADLALGTTNGAAPDSSLRSAIYWFPAGILVAIGYLAMNLRLHRDRVPGEGSSGAH